MGVFDIVFFAFLFSLYIFIPIIALVLGLKILKRKWDLFFNKNIEVEKTLDNEKEKE